MAVLTAGEVFAIRYRGFDQVAEDVLGAVQDTEDLADPTLVAEQRIAATRLGVLADSTNPQLALRSRKEA